MFCRYVQRAVRLKEAASRWFFQQLIIGLDYCHRRGVVNRDIKLENTLLQVMHLVLVRWGLHSCHNSCSLPSSDSSGCSNVQPAMLLFLPVALYCPHSCAHCRHMRCHCADNTDACCAEKAGHADCSVVIGCADGARSAAATAEDMRLWLQQSSLYECAQIQGKSLSLLDMLWPQALNALQQQRHIWQLTSRTKTAWQCAPRFTATPYSVCCRLCVLLLY